MSGSRQIAAHLLPWYREHGRHDLPWRQTRDDYALWLAEIMLQQTQVQTVLGYYARFLERFGDWSSLAAAPMDEVLALWSGLGYYARGRNAHATAQIIVRDWGGRFPQDLHQALTLPGVGRSTAAAVLSSAWGQRQAILDANARRVLYRFHGLQGDPRAAPTERALWRLAEAETPAAAHDYNQAIQDLGALYCRSRQTQCGCCPLASSCSFASRGKDHAARIDAVRPAPSNRRPKPQRLANLLCLEDSEGRVWLERRPNTGIWGGLWCLPVLSLGEAPIPLGMVRERSATYGVWTSHSAPLRHVFTHFILEYQVHHVRSKTLVSSPGVGEDGFFAIAAALSLGLPSPIRRYLQSLLERPGPS